MSRSSRRSDVASAARAASRPSSRDTTCCCTSARPDSRARAGAQRTAAIARTTNGSAIAQMTPNAT